MSKFGMKKTYTVVPNKTEKQSRNMESSINLNLNSNLNSERPSIANIPNINNLNINNSNLNNSNLNNSNIASTMNINNNNKRKDFRNNKIGILASKRSEAVMTPG